MLQLALHCSDPQLWCAAVRCAAVRCGALRCGAVRCGALRCAGLSQDRTTDCGRRTFCSDGETNGDASDDVSNEKCSEPSIGCRTQRATCNYINSAGLINRRRLLEVP